MSSSTGYHTSGNNRKNCNDVSTCKLKDKHPELVADIRTLQRELKELEQKFAKAKSDHDVFVTSRQRAKSSFLAIMRSRVRKQNKTTLNCPRTIDVFATSRQRAKSSFFAIMRPRLR